MGRGDGNAGPVPDLAGVELAEGYRILELRSAGRVAMVYEAQSLRDGRRVAIKVLLPQLSTSRRHVERFLESARVGAGLNHPNIAAVYGCGRVPGGAVYFARAYLEGERLRRSLAERGGIPWVQAKPLLAQLLDALAAAHRQRVTHGGVEPARCWLVGGEGDPARSQLMVTGFGVFGGPRDPWPVPEVYRAPELERGAAVGFETDVFGVGALAYELLSGARWSKADHARSTGLRELVPDVPAAVDRVIERALHPDAAHRHPDAIAMLAAFREAAGLAPASEPEEVAPARAPASRAASSSFRYPPPPLSLAPPAPAPGRHPTFVDHDDSDELSTAVHAGVALESLPVPIPIGTDARASVRAASEGTVRLAGAGLGAGAREETIVLPHDPLAPALDDDEPTATREAADLNEWGTVVLPGGGHPAHFADRTQLLSVDEPEPSAAVSLTTMLSVSLGAPEPVAAVNTASLAGMDGAQLGHAGGSGPSSGRSSPWPGPSAVAFPMPVRGPAGAPGAWPIPRVAPASPPMGGHPLVSGPHPLVSGPHPLVSAAYPVVTPTGGSPIVRRAGGRGRHGAYPLTGAHANLRSTGDPTTRLAWGFLLGVLIAVGIIGGAVALALFLSR